MGKTAAGAGRVHDRQASEAFRIGVTTPAEAVATPGDPDMDMDLVRSTHSVRSRFRPFESERACPCLHRAGAEDVGKVASGCCSGRGNRRDGGRLRGESGPSHPPYYPR